MDQPAEKKDKTERVIGLGSRTREELVKWNQMTALPDVGGGETSDIPGLPSGAALQQLTRTSVSVQLTWTASGANTHVTSHVTSPDHSNKRIIIIF